MRILVIANDIARGQFLEREIRRLGHQTRQVTRRAPETAELLSTADGVLIQMEPDCSVVRFAHAVAMRWPDLAIGFATGHESRPEELDAAASIGPVLGKWWTARDLAGVVDSLGLRANVSRTPRWCSRTEPEYRRSDTC